MQKLKPGSIVIWKEQSWQLMDIPELNKVLLKHIETNRVELANADELKLSSSSKNKSALISISKEAWLDVQTQFNLLKPLLRKKKRDRTYEEIDAVAKQFGKNRITIYRWLSKLEAEQTATALLREKRNDIGRSRLKSEIDQIVTEQIDQFYLVKERPTVVELWEQIVISCREKKLSPPSRTTVQRRVDRIQDRLVMAKRYSPKTAREYYQPMRGSFPGADVPLAVYQIDHTPVDIILVDDVYRQPIGRAYLTIVTDSCTRMLAGFCISLDHPGALATGLALSHAILPKKMWLAKHNIDTDWPIYGVPQKIFADNAAEFRGTMLERACQEYGIVMENRPKGLPNYGGHVERLFRTFMHRVQSVQGTTFSNTKEKGDYDSEKKSILTLNEFEHWFGIFVTKVYHQRPHRGIGRMAPIKLYEKFVFGDESTRSIGLPAPIQDERKLHLDFMPYIERTIQEYGVLVNGIHYYADVLKPWIHARDLTSVKLKRKFIFARDPRDISVIYFLDPDTNIYHDIPYGNTYHPPMSHWELMAILKRLGERPELQVNEDLIFEGLKEMRQVQESAAVLTKVARRQTQRRKGWEAPKPQKVLSEKPVIAKASLYTEELVPFDVEEAE